MTAPFSYGTWRTYGHYALSWAELEPTQSGFVWGAMDARVSEAQGAGIQICFPIWATPVWAGGNEAPASGLTLTATTGTITATAGSSVFNAGHVGKALSTGVGWGAITAQSGTTATVTVDRPFASTSVSSGSWFIAAKGPWTLPGESAVPTDAQYVTDFVTALLTRYNTGRVRQIKFLELWNEPFPGVSPSYWLGTNEELVEMCWAAYSAAKAVDPGIVVLAPSFYTEGTLRDFLLAQDVNGKYGYETFDWLNIHQYSQGPNKALNGRDLYYDNALGVLAANRVLTGVGQSARPVAGTEWGIAATGDSSLTAFYALTAPERKVYIQRMIAMAALNGMQLFTIFSYYNDDIGGGLAGDYRNDATGVMAAVTDVFTKLAGQTIIAGGWRADGSVEVTLAGNVVYTW